LREEDEVALKERQTAIGRIQKLRNGRKLVAICNLDRAADPPQLPGLSSQFEESIKEPLFRVLKETVGRRDRLDVFLYTRGGATNAVWPIAGLLREFDPDFEVLIPFRAHSSGTMLAIAANKIVMTALSELSPIDPTTANPFNPREPTNQQAHLGIAVEDVTSYQEFWKQVFEFENSQSELPLLQKYQLLQPHIARLSTEIHPLALGNVQRVYTQIRVLAKLLLERHYGADDGKIRKIIDSLTKEFYSHHHMINREEARKILGRDHIKFADRRLATEIDSLLRQYENDFAVRRTFFLGRFMGDDAEKSARFVNGVVESAKWSYLNATEIKIRQYVAPPPGVQIQVPPGATPPLVPGLPRRWEWQIMEQGWSRNASPRGVTT
jgi:hypothetical protein